MTAYPSDIKKNIAAPQSEQQLMARVNAIAGLTVQQLADQCCCRVPENLRHNKGWLGQLIEAVLGTDAGNMSEPDFVGLGIELKTIPVKPSGMPAETTYVCVVPLYDNLGMQWQHCCVARKLSRVLWMPVESHKEKPLKDKIIGQGFIWSPDPKTEQMLKTDWEELMEYVALGQIDQIDAGYGEYLQIRPKAADAAARTTSISSQGNKTVTVPRGFYLRTSFTYKIIQDYLT